MCDVSPFFPDFLFYLVDKSGLMSLLSLSYYFFVGSRTRFLYGYLRVVVFSTERLVLSCAKRGSAMPLPTGARGIRRRRPCPMSTTDTRHPRKQKQKESKSHPTPNGAERLKTVVRRLPPNLPEEIFWQSVQAWVTDDTVTWKSYCPGKLRTKRYVPPLGSSAPALEHM